MDTQAQTNALKQQLCNTLVGISAEETAMNCEKVLGLLSSRILLSDATPDENEKEAVWLIMKMVRAALKSSAPGSD